MAMNMNGRKIKAPYQLKALGKIPVTSLKASYVKQKDGTSKLLQEPVTEEQPAWLLQCAMGHQTRFVGERGWAEIVRMGYDKKPRLIDLETGDVVDIGGDPYDLDGPELAPTKDLILSDE